MNQSLSRFALQCRGCEPLKWDANRLKGVLVDRGLVEVPRIEDADLVVVLGCSFSQDEEDRLEATVRGLAVDRSRVVIVSGCYLRGHPFENVYYARSGDVPAILDTIISARPAVPAVTAQSPSPPPFFVAISEGCYGRCTFCSIPLVRGRHRSRPLSSVLKDVRKAAAEHSTVKLVGQDVAAYGRDIETSLGALVRRVFESMPEVSLEFGTLGVRWLKGMAERDLALLADSRVSGNIHVPLQSASNAVLRRMRRGYQIEDYLSTLARLKDLGITRLSTDILAGFPGETLEDHSRTVELLRREVFVHAQIFAYDPRPGTPAAAMPQIPRPERVRRALELIAVFLATRSRSQRSTSHDGSYPFNSNLRIETEEVLTNEG